MSRSSNRRAGLDGSGRGRQGKLESTGSKRHEQTDKQTRQRDSRCGGDKQEVQQEQDEIPTEFERGQMLDTFAQSRSAARAWFPHPNRLEDQPHKTHRLGSISISLGYVCLRAPCFSIPRVFLICTKHSRGVRHAPT